MNDKDRADRLAARCESQRLKIEEQAERIKALEGALREWLRVDEIGRDPNTHRESFIPMKREIVNRARALLGEK